MKAAILGNCRGLRATESSPAPDAVRRRRPRARNGIPTDTSQ